jgi:hypothetical protein
MKKFCVRFAGDNDFINTVEPFVKFIAVDVLYNESFSKAKIVELFNNHAYSLYILNQSRDKKEDQSYKEYLKITEAEVLFDEEIDQFTNWNHDGCLAYLNHNEEIKFSIF